MTHKRRFVLAIVVLLVNTFLDPAFGGVRRERPDSRPTILEIGEPYSISAATVQREAEKISDLRDFLIRNGYPDYAEVQEISPDWPWESYEVRLYYMRWNLEADFGHVLFSDALADLGVLKYQGDIGAPKRHEIEVILDARSAPPAPPAQEAAPIAPMPPASQAAPVPQAEAAPAEPQAAAPAPLSDAFYDALATRLEASADRAARAADAAVEQSEAAVRAADRTVSIVEKLEQTARASGARRR